MSLPTKLGNISPFVMDCGSMFSEEMGDSLERRRRRRSREG